MAASPQLPGHYVSEQVYAGITVVAVVLLLVWLAGGFPKTRRRAASPPGGLITGADNRYSTGKAIAVGWTMLVGWMVVTEAYIAIHSSQASFDDLLTGASDLYFVFLGGPYAAAVFAKASVQSKISQGVLTKTSARNPTPLDVIADDNGNVDVYDFQYTLFNVLAVLIVAFIFAAHPGHGLPDIPQFLAILTGGAALTYTVNKTIASDGPMITGVIPAEARVGDTVTIVGSQLFSGPAGSPLPTVTIGAITATPVNITGPNTLTATVVGAPANTLPLSGALNVVVTPAVGSPIVSRNAITIVADEPKLVALTPQPFQQNSSITVAGRFLLPAGASPGTATGGVPMPGGLTVALTASDQNWPITFLGSYSDEVITLQVGAQPANLPGNAGVVQDATLTLTRGTTAQAQVRYQKA